MNMIMKQLNFKIVLLFLTIYVCPHRTLAQKDTLLYRTLIQDSILIPQKSQTTIEEEEGIFTEVPKHYRKYDKRVHRYRSAWEALIPTHTKIQYAGGMGLLSWGIGWDYGKRGQWETDLLLGFIPRCAMIALERSDPNMKSKTKTLPTDAVLRDMLKQAGLDSAGVQFRLLGDGMFNAVFAAETNPPVVMKIAPRSQVPVMTYERDMLATELYWYDQIRQHTEIIVPDILYSDPAGNLCGAPWVVMERLPGVHRDKCPLPSAEKHRRTAEMVAQIHNVSGTGYGYVQNGLYENWADAYISMIENLLADARRMGKTSRRGQRLLAYARQYRAVLAAAPCVMVNFDLWRSNILCHTVDGQTRFAWIDPERSLWGDPVLDFLPLESFTAPLDKKTLSLAAHNALCRVPVQVNRETRLRYAFAQGLLALIQEVEKYYRFTPLSQGWMVDIGGASVAYKAAFAALRRG